MSLQLNPELDTAKIAAEFRSKRRVRIDNVLEAGSAEAIFDCLRHYTAWELCYSGANGEPMRVSHQDFIQMDADELTSLGTEVHKRGGSSYQYIYKCLPMVDAITVGRVTEKSMLYDIATFLNSAPFMQFARDVTADNRLVKLDPHANLYEPSHFKNLHDDMRIDRSARDRSIRHYAIVLGFTKNWSVNWGGNMSFYPAPNPISAESSYPGFNTIEIFEVPALHRVSMVMPFAAKGRYTIAGWLREDADIIRLDLGDKTPQVDNTVQEESATAGPQAAPAND
jgi:SM-20-related protein